MLLGSALGSITPAAGLARLLLDGLCGWHRRFGGTVLPAPRVPPPWAAQCSRSRRELLEWCRETVPGALGPAPAVLARGPLTAPGWIGPHALTLRPGAGLAPWAGLTGTCDKRSGLPGVTPRGVSLHRRKLKHTFQFFTLDEPKDIYGLFVKMGAAQVSCCVGGNRSCIGAWGVGTLHALPFCSCCLASLLYTILVWDASGFLLLTKWRCWCVGG